MTEWRYGIREWQDDEQGGRYVFVEKPLDYKSRSQYGENPFIFDAADNKPVVGCDEYNVFDIKAVPMLKVAPKMLEVLRVIEAEFCDEWESESRRKAMDRVREVIREATQKPKDIWQFLEREPEK